MISNSKHSYTK